ncbi:hypothetical protein [Ilumatobacter sp.]|uniref:hypothetical protein n=1 Tax=Ilumatobacter sp. TaxID=1967498 RepID=UPI003AF4217A
MVTVTVTRVTVVALVGSFVPVMADAVGVEDPDCGASVAVLIVVAGHVVVSSSACVQRRDVVALHRTINIPVGWKVK